MIYPEEDMNPPICFVSDIFDKNKIPPSSPCNKEIVEQYAKNDQYGIPYPENREWYDPQNHFLYWYNGLVDYFNCINRINEMVPNFTIKRVLDFGGSTGRIARHFLHKPDVKVTIMDLNIKHIKWVRKYFHGKITAIQNTANHHIPFEDNSIDLIIGNSLAL